MKTKILFSYTQEIVPPRCRKSRPVRFNDGVFECEIPEVTGAEAPVAIRSHGQFVFDEDKTFSVDYRWYKGKLWTSANLGRYTPSGYTSRKDDWDHRPFPAFLDATVTEYVNFSDYYLRLNYCAGETKEQIVETLKLQIAKCLVIDGVWYRPAGEPRYVVMTFGLGNNHGGTAVFADSGYNPNISHNRYFSLHDREKAIALATEIAQRRGDDRSLPMKVNGNPRFEILIPESIQVKPTEQHGDGDPFINKLDAITDVCGGAPIAGIMVAMAAAAETGQGSQKP